MTIRRPVDTGKRAERDGYRDRGHLRERARRGRARGPRHADLVERQLGDPPAQLSAGSSSMVGDVAVNRGPAGAGASVTRYYLAEGGTVLVVGSRRVPALKRHQRSRARVRLSIPADAPAGRYSLLACVDANRRVAESNERNNCRARDWRDDPAVVASGPSELGPAGAGELGRPRW